MPKYRQLNLKIFLSQKKSKKFSMKLVKFQIYPDANLIYHCTSLDSDPRDDAGTKFEKRLIFQLQFWT